MATRLNELAFGYSAAIIAAAGMLLLGILGNLGIYLGAVEMMGQWHMYFSLSVLGVATGMIEAAIISFIFGYAFGWAYNRLA